MFESKLAVVINPQMLNKFEESKTTVEMVEKAIEKGYVLSNRTPDFLFKYEAIVDLLIKTQNNVSLFLKHFDTLMTCEARRKELTRFIAKHFREVGYRLPAEYFVDYVDEISDNAEFIQCYLGVPYLEKHLDYVYSKDFDLDNYYASDEILDFLEKNNVDFNKLYRGVDNYIEDYIRRFPQILKAEPFKHDLHSFKAYRVIKEMISEGLLKYDDIPHFLIDEDLLELLIINEPSLLDKHPEYIDKLNDRYGGNKCIKKFLEELPDSLENMEPISYAYSIYNDNDRQKIIDAIKESGFLINRVKWEFILNDNELIMDQIRRNPNILNTCPNLMSYSVTEDDYKEIMDIVETSGITLYTMQGFYYNNEDFIKFLIKNNPFVFYNLSRDNNVLGYRGKELGEYFEGPITPSAPPYGETFDEGFLEAVRMNPYNYYALLGDYNDKEYALEAYEAFLQSGVDIHGAFSRTTLPKMRFDNIEQLRSNGATKTCLDTYGDEYMDYPLYYVANHPDMIEVRNPNNTFYLRVPSEKRISSYPMEVDGLLEDFSNYRRLKKDLSQEELSRINDLYWANKDKVVVSKKELASNHYIYINELLLHNNMISDSFPEFTDEELEYFNKRFKELNCSINDRNYYYVRDFDLLYEALNNGNRLRHIDLNWMNQTQKETWFNVLKEKIQNENFLIVDIPVEFMIENYDFIKEHYDYASIFSKLHYYVNDGEHNEILLDLLDNYCSHLYLDDLKNLDEYAIRMVLNKNSHLLAIAKRRYDDLDFWIQDIIDEYEYENISIDVDGELSKEQLDKIFNQNPTNINLLMNYKHRKNISDELYLEYYKKCLLNIKNGFAADNVEFDSEVELPIDLELLDYLSKVDRKLSVEYLKSYYNREHDFVIKYLLDNYDKYKMLNAELVEVLNNEDVYMFISNHKDFLDERLFKQIFVRFNADPVGLNKLYEWWVMVGKPVNDTIYFNNGLIAQDILSNWEGDLFEFGQYSHDVDSPVGINMIYNYFKSQGDKVDITSSKLFYENPLILLDYAGEEIPFPPPLSLGWRKELEIQLLIAKDKPGFIHNIGKSYFIDKLIKEDPVKMMELMPYKNDYAYKIMNALKEIGYEFNENTPTLYLKDQEALLRILENNNDAIDFVIDVIEKNDISLDYSNNRSLKDYVSKIVVERGLTQYVKYINTYDLNDFLIEALDKDFSVINSFKDVRIDMNVLKHIFSVAIQKIESGEYVIDENTPYFLYYSDEIRAMAREINPRLLDNCPLERLDRARDHSMIYDAIEDPNKVDEMFNGVVRNFPEDLVNQLVDKLIENGYKVSNKTPNFLLCNCKFVYHQLKNNVNIDDKYIHNFVTFENYYKLKDSQMFTELINKGYGYEFKKFILQFGLDTTLELAAQYGYLLNLVDLASVRNIDDIPVLLVSGAYALDVFERVPDLDSFLNRCDSLKVSSYQYSNALMKKYLKDIEANKEKIILLIKHGFSFSFDEQMGKIFNSNPVLLNMYVSYSPLNHTVCSIINNCDAEMLSNELMMNAINNGYVINEYTPVHIRTNPVYVYEIISKVKTSSDITSMINRHKDIALNQAIINKLIDLGYEITSSTPDVILGNLEFLVPYFDRCKYSSDYRTGMKLVSSNIYKELLYLIDIKKMVLYFKDIVPADNYEMFTLDFINIAESKRDVLIKMLTDGKKLNESIKTSYEKYILEHIGNIKYEDMDKVVECLIRISQSNSGEIRQFANTLVEEVLKFDNYEAAFNKVEDIFLQDHLPMVTKLFLVFKVLHKDYSRFNGTYLSPVLKNATDQEKDDIIYKDLLRSAFRSNNRSLLEYLHDLSDACDVLEQYENDKENVNIDKLNKALMFLLAIVNSSYVKNHDSSEVKLTNDYDSLITMLNEQFKSYGNLKDAIVQNLFDFPTYEAAVKYIHDYAIATDKRNRERVAEGFVVKPGDYIKGIGSVNYLTNILQNGSVSKEFLGDSADSDATPLDTDLSRINIETSSVGEAINSTAASGYGSDIYFILKDGSRFAVTRTKDGGDSLESADPDKLESFYTSVCDNNNSDHYGIRTGFASSEIDFIVSTDKKTQLEVALNGFYIPIVDREGNLLFTPEDYDKLRAKMSGIEYYGSGPYQMASYEDLIAPGVLEMAQNVSDNRIGIRLKHNAIKAAVRKGMSEVNVVMKDKLDGNVKAGYADLIDTGSTARGTDLPGKADFDYICRVDRSLFNNPTKFQEFKDSIRNQFVSIDKEEYVNGNFRFKGVVVEGLDEKVDIDLSFVIRTTKLTISSDESLLTRMDAIESGSYTVSGDRTIDDPVEARNLVTGNILMAKKLLKAYKCYKKHNSPEKEGGLGGIGIENWILQHGGSLKRAAEDFMNIAENCKTYDEFKKQYSIWDFGQNHYSLEGSDYSHDDFVYKNMDAAGYERMKAALKCYLEYGMKALDEEVAAEIVNKVNERVMAGNGRSL